MQLKIRSGGQTGVDRTALEIAKTLGLRTGGFVPRGCKTERGPAPELVTEFGCTETASEDYIVRTSLNVQASDATIWFGRTGTRGFRATLKHVQAYRRPYLLNPMSIESIVTFIRTYGVQDLNVAGNRASTLAPRTLPHMHEVLGGALSLLIAQEVPSRTSEIPPVESNSSSKV